MEQDWSIKKKLLFWLAFFAVVVGILIIIDVFDFQPMDNLYVKIVVYVIFGLFGLMTIYVGVWIAVMFPYAIVKDIKEKRKVRDAKWAAYSILDEFGTTQLKERINHYRQGKLKGRNEIGEIMEILSKKHEDREARHLVNDLYELERELEQIPNNEEEEES